MCTQPIRIKNRSRFYRENHFRPELIVPCGQCDDCRLQNQNEWSVRCLAEVQHCLNQGGKVLYFTLTYNNNCLPTIDLDINGTIRTVPAFNHKDKDRFFNSLRKHFSRLGVKKPFRYIITSEYGSNPLATRRSHYHVFLFFSPECVEVLPNSDNKVKQLIQKYWSYSFWQNGKRVSRILGFVRWSKNPPQGFGIWVTKEYAAVYATKYVSKDLDFYNNPDIQSYFYADGKRIQSRFTQFRKHLPRHFQSLGFGAQLCERILKDKDLLNIFLDGFDFNDKTLIDYSKGRLKRFKIPRYILNKIFQVKSLHNSTSLSLIGMQIKRSIFKNQVERAARNLVDKFSVSGIKKRLCGYPLTDLFKHQFKSVDELSVYMTDLLSGFDFKTFIYFNKVWRGTITLDKSLYDTLFQCDNETYEKLSLLHYNDELLKQFDPTQNRYDSDPNWLTRQSSFIYFIDSLPFHRNFIILSDILDKLDSFYRYNCTKSFLEDRALRKLQKSQYMEL